jgi:Xaa-Pro aminopeptidase
MSTSFDAAPFLERRRRFAESIGDGVALIPGAQEVVRNRDIYYAFRQNSDFFFLTGFDEPDAVALINPTGVKERFVLFVRPRDREREIWHGYRAGPEGAMATYGADAAYRIDQFDQKLREYAIDRTALYYQIGNAAYDAKITQLLTPTVSLGVTYAVADTYGCDDGRIWPTRCAVIDAALDGR